MVFPPASVSVELMEEPVHALEIDAAIQPNRYNA